MLLWHGNLVKIGGAQPLFGAREAFVHNLTRSANDLAGFGGAEALHHAQEQARHVVVAQLCQRGAECLALSDALGTARSSGSRSATASSEAHGRRRRSSDTARQYAV